MNKNEIMDIAQKMGYKGDSNTEADAWVKAVEKGLDMSEEARFERAREMGFKTDTIYYHGTRHQFDRFDKSKIGMNYTYSEDSGFFFTIKKRTAENYSINHKTLEVGRVLEVFLKFEDSYVTSTNSEYYDPSDRFDISGPDMMHDVRLNKRDSILIKGTNNDDICIVMEPSQILSIHAAFDPETENYKPEINLEEELDELMLTYSLPNGAGVEELNKLVADYCEQENKNKDQIKEDFYKASHLERFPPEDSDYVEGAKNRFDDAIDKHYDEKLKKELIEKVDNHYKEEDKPKKKAKRTMKNK